MSAACRVEFYVFFPSGGIGKYTHQQLEALREYEDLELELTCLPEFQWLEASGYRTWPHLASISHRFAPIRKAKFLAGQWINPRRFLKRARSFHADILHICNINHLTFPFWEGRIGPRMKLVATAHDVRRQGRILHRGWEARQLRHFYRRCDAIFVHGEGQEAELVAYADIPREKVQIVPMGPFQYAPAPAVAPEVLRREYHVPADRPLMLFFGFIRPEKNLAELLRALSLAKAKPHLLVAGEAADRNARYIDDCRRLVEESGLQSQVTFVQRYIRDEEIPRLFHMADMIAVPYDARVSSQSGVLHVGTFYRRPVLVTPTPCFAETLAHSDVGEVAEGFDPPALAKAIDRLCARVGEGARFEFDQFEAYFSWERNAALTRDVYQRLLHPGCREASRSESPGITGPKASAE